MNKVQLFLLRSETIWGEKSKTIVVWHEPNLQRNTLEKARGSAGIMDDKGRFKEREA